MSSVPKRTHNITTIAFGVRRCVPSGEGTGLSGFLLTSLSRISVSVSYLCLCLTSLSLSHISVSVSHLCLCLTSLSM
jgi:hypothetical protein